MADQEYLDQLRRGVESWNRWRREYPEIRPDLSAADLSAADLWGADLRRANLRRANLRRAILNSTDLSGARLNEANLSGAFMGNTIIARVNLSETRGLGEIFHLFSSRIELYSVRLPQDGSTLHFLRGCGVPDEWIDDYRAHMMSPIQYHSCFIGYSSRDEILARRLHADLQA